MQWQAEGIVIGTRKQGENNILLEVLTPDRGRCLGLVRGGRSRRQQPALQLGNHLNLTWRARLDEHLGFFTVEPLQLRAAHLMQTARSIHGLQSLCAQTRLLPERDPHPSLFHALDIILDHLDDPQIGAALVLRFELELLNELGFGLDLSQCAATGETDELIWVSPKSGRAVSKAAGLPYADKLLKLPDFMKAPQSRLATSNQISSKDMEAGFTLTGYFLFKYIYEPRNISWPDARDNYMTALKKDLAELSK
ncbi:DNA repair protein RecO [Pseudovibrio axinellae]|uniref:DNA repair protein RecO n=1 Tax=Pseudovibrio axinellae TaxID=989403 RepID=A0A165WPT7_9HYPH|nr:DNA repair protein RecO [Pseudovibrio axinellae]KZL16773.1 DNA repair protein RecO [Pseudovibrio axinellae]SEQ75210.1 DNA replication and repair protein RecO [Pseudovibrio axinellae]